MNARSRMLTLTMVALLAGLGAWRLWGAADESTQPPDEIVDRPADPALVPPVLQGRDVEPSHPPQPTFPDAPTPGIALTVRVLDDANGRALADAVVAVAQGADAPRAFRTDDAGVVKIDDLRPGELRVVARVPTFVRAEAYRELGGTEAQELEMRLARGVVLEGTVVEVGTGRAVAGASVVVAPGGSLDGWTQLTVASAFGGALTDEQGRFRVDGIAPDVLLTARATAEGYGAASQSMRLPSSVDAPTAVVLRLPPAAVLTGSVRRPGGEPAAGARVYAVPADAPEMLIADPESQCVSDGKPFRSLRAVTDDDGVFRIDGLELEAFYIVFAELEGHGRSSSKTGVVATEEDPRPHLELVLQGAASLTVRVLDPDGEPQAEGRLSLFGDGFPLDLELRSPGVFAVREPPPGTYVLRVVCAGTVMHELPVEIRAAEQKVIEVRLERGLTLAGVLVDDTGRPIAGQKLFVGRPWQQSGKHLPSRGDAETDDQGRFTIVGLRDGPHTLSLVLGRHVIPDDLRLNPPADDLRIVALRKAGIRVRLELPPDFTPPAEVGIRVGREEDGGYGESGSRRPWNAGELHFDDLAPGAAKLRIQVEGLLEVVRDLTLKPGDVADLGTIAMDAGFELEGRVVDEADRSVAGARVTAGQVWTPMHREVATGADGRFVLLALARGENEIEITAPGFLPRTVAVVMPGEASGRSFVLERGCFVTVRVTAADGRPAPARRVRWRPAQIAEEPTGTDSEDTDAKGLLEVRLPDGAWIFEVLDDDWEPVTETEAELTKDGAATVELALPR